MASISLCMIVKNEARVLARCLDSLAGIPDEIIIVDTGSTDNTKEIAARYTKKLFDYSWNDDFSAARNFSLSKATCAYVYCADADEVLDEVNLRRFYKLKEALLDEVEIVEMGYANQMDFNTTANFALEYRPKLFRRLRPFLYTGPIHEVLRTEPIVFRSDIIVQHRPTSNHAPRDLTHLARITQNGLPLGDRLEMMYARELVLAGGHEDFKAARKYFESVRLNPNSSRDAIRRAACVLARLAVYGMDCLALLRVCSPILADNPPSEICLCMGDLFFNTGNIIEAANWYDAAIEHATPELAAIAAGPLPMAGLIKCFEANEDYVRAQEYRKRLEEWTPEKALQ